MAAIVDLDFLNSMAKKKRNNALQTIELSSDEPAATNAVENRAEARAFAFMETIGKAFQNPQFSDATIRLGTVEMPAHRFVLAAQSEYFATALSSSFAEAETGIFEYKEGSMHAHWRCFQYIYTGNYSEEPAEALAVPGDDDALSKDVRVYALAQYFKIKGLEDYSLKKFQSQAEKLWDTPQFVNCIRDAYASTVVAGCKMRKVIVKVTSQHLSELWKEPLQELVREGGDFAVDLMAEMTKSSPQAQPYSALV